MQTQIDYSAVEWQASVGHFPLTACTREELLLLHRHWMWANQQREAMERTFGTDCAPSETGPLMMASVGIGFMFVWYGMLWTVIEACTVERSLDLRGAFRAEIDKVGPQLKHCRNAVMHVPKSNALLDDRIAHSTHRDHFVQTIVITHSK
jgi:hypothetical protein